MSICYSQEKLTMSKFTQVDNIIFDKLMAYLGDAEFKVFMAIYRKTIGWGDVVDCISTSQIMSLTGLSNRSVINNVQSLKDKNIIIVESRPRTTNKIRLNLAVINNEQTYEQCSQAKAKKLVKKVHKDVMNIVHKSYEQCSQVAYEQCSQTKETRNTLYKYTYKYSDFVYVNKFANAIKKPKQKSKRDLEIEQIFSTWLSLTGQKIKFDNKRKSNINARLENGYTVEQITKAMTYVANSTWHKQNGQVRLELVVRSNEQLDQQLLKAEAQSNSGLDVNKHWKIIGKQQQAPLANVNSLDAFFMD